MAQTLMVRVRVGKLNRHRKGEFSLFKSGSRSRCGGEKVCSPEDILYQSRYLQLISIIGVQQCLKQIFK